MISGRGGIVFKESQQGIVSFLSSATVDKLYKFSRVIKLTNALERS